MAITDLFGPQVVELRSNELSPDLVEAVGGEEGVAKVSLQHFGLAGDVFVDELLHLFHGLRPQKIEDKDRCAGRTPAPH